MAGLHHEEGVGFLSNDLQTRDKQNQDVESSEQYAINAIGDRALQSAEFVLKEGKRALEDAAPREVQFQPPRRKKTAKKRQKVGKNREESRNYSTQNEPSTQDLNQESFRRADEEKLALKSSISPRPILTVRNDSRLISNSEKPRKADSRFESRQDKNGVSHVVHQQVYVNDQPRETDKISRTLNPLHTPKDCAASNNEVHTDVDTQRLGDPHIQPHLEDETQVVEQPENSDDIVPISAEQEPYSTDLPALNNQPVFSGTTTKAQRTRPKKEVRRSTSQAENSSGYAEIAIEPETTSYPEAESGLHRKATSQTLRTYTDHPLNTWQNDTFSSGLKNEGAALNIHSESGVAMQSLQTAGRSAGSAGASAAANAAAPGVGAAIQATEKAVTKVKETVESIAASASRSSSSWGALAALFLMPLLIIVAIAGAFRGGGSARNTNLSADVIALMPQISAACQANGIPEYTPLVAAVIMQESGGRVADVGGDVMQCAEGMGLPVGTPVSVEDSINFGTGIIARNLREAGAAGPTDIPRISLALQGYNFGNGYISWALARGGYSKENAREFSEWQAGLHGWSGYGDIDYVDHVLRYYQVSVGGMGDTSAIADGRFAYPFPGRPWDTYPGHNGIDISFANCYGEPVYAVAAGTVRYTQDGWTPAHGVGGMWSFGNSVFIEHGDGWISAYGHLSALAVASGETVTQGQLIGYIGSTGNSTGPHLHLALYHNGDAGIGGQNFAELAWPQLRE